MLTGAQIQENYQQILQMAGELLSRQLKMRGYRYKPDNESLQEIVLTVAGSEPVVQLMTTEPWHPATFSPVIEQELENARKLLMPDVSRRNVVSLDNSFDWLSETPDSSNEEIPQTKTSPDAAEQWRQLLPPDCQAELVSYMREKLVPALGLENLQLMSFANSNSGDTVHAIDKLELLFHYFPSADFSVLHTPIGNNPTDTEIQRAYVLELVGLKRVLPPNFLDENGEKKAAVLVKLLINDILKIRPGELLEKDDPEFFARYSLQNVYRYFNYSTNRVLSNAFGQLVQPWVKSKSDNNYWLLPENRRAAIRWLLETRLGILPGKIYCNRITRSNFSDNGLSYMFNQYYNSVTRALQDAYPQLQIWEVGNVPWEYWTEVTAGEAVRWMIKESGWMADDLPDIIGNGELNRKTFSRFGLATLFERYFSRSISKAVDTAYPGRFQQWEIGKVPRDFWKSRYNIYQAACWVAGKEGVAVHEIPSALRSGRLSAESFEKYGIPAVLRKWSRGNIRSAFAPALVKAHQTLQREQKMLRRIKALKQQHKKLGVLYYLLHGFFLFEEQRSRKETARRYDRLARRISRRMEVA